ncbi:MAG TPA: hypothetical protein VM469_12985 [Pseudoxanthomonas sp.]|nr:hypothetical protein [Pseudoxanthomonas sp.]
MKPKEALMKVWRRWLAGIVGLLTTGCGLLMIVVALAAEPLNEGAHRFFQFIPWLGLYVALFGASLLLYVVRPVIGGKILKILLVLAAFGLVALAFQPVPVFQDQLSTRIAVVAFAALLLLRFSGLLKRKPREA